MRLGLGTENLCIKVFDPEDKKIIAVFDTYKKASARLGVRGELLLKKSNNKKRMYSPTYNKEVAIRIGAKTEEMDKLIDKTNKYKPL